MPTTLSEFEAIFPQLVKDIEEQCQNAQLPKQALDWYSKVRHIRPQSYYSYH